jgi:hypothetical protein
MTNAKGIAERCHKLIARFYEMPTSNISGKLLIVSLPGWMEAHDIDLIKTALKFYADSLAPHDATTWPTNGKSRR